MSENGCYPYTASLKQDTFQHLQIALFFFLLQSPVFMYILIHGNLKFQFLLNVSYPPQGYKTDYKTSYDSLKVQIASEMS